MPKRSSIYKKISSPKSPKPIIIILYWAFWGTQQRHNNPQHATVTSDSGPDLERAVNSD